MSPMRVTILSLLLFTGVVVSGVGIYAATASDTFHSTDGYGISESGR